MMNTRVILNSGASRVEGEEVMRTALENVAGVTVLLPEDAADSRRMVRQAIDEGCERIFAAGGDGTLNLVVNAVAPDFDRIAVGLLPLGTANDFARTLELPTDVEGFQELLASGRERPVDLIRVTSGGQARYAVNVSAGGFSGVVDEALDPESKKSWGAWAYLRAALESLPDLVEYHARPTLEDEPPVELPVYNVAVAKGRFVGGGVPVAPDAAVDDGLMDVLVLPALGFAQLAALVPRLLAQSHTESEALLFRQVRRFTVDATPQLPFNVDGELIGEEAVTFEVVAGVLRFVGRG